MEALIRYIDSKEPEMLSFLGKLVNIDCGTYSKNGVDQVGNILADRLSALNFSVRREPQEAYGDHVVGHKPGTDGNRMLFIGHMDTVFPDGTAEKRPFRIESGRAYGPGVCDMKGGITCLIYALEALKEANPDVYGQITMDVVFNSDEEILSPTSKSIIENLAKQAQTVCVFEPARPGGEYVIRRKGVGKYILKVSGRAAHSGAQPEDGRSAIGEMAHKIIALHALTDYETGTTVNVGVVRGGERSNVVAESAYAEIDIRVFDAEAADHLDAQMRSIAANSNVPDTTGELTGGVQFPPMVPTSASERLFKGIQDAGRILDLKLEGIATGGGSDGNHAAQYAPTLDGMGAQGSGAHSDREFMVVDTLTERTKVTALFLTSWPDIIKNMGK